MQRILAAVDRTPMAKSVIHQAGKLAAQFGSEVIVVNVLEQRRLRFFSEVLDPAETYKLEQVKNNSQQVAEEAAKGLEDCNVSYRAIGRIGSPAREICQLAETMNADAIVIGFEGVHGPQRFRALGSVVHKVLDNVSCPVTVVHHARGEGSSPNNFDAP